MTLYINNIQIMTKVQLYDDDFMINRVINSMDNNIKKVSIIQPNISKLNRKTYIFNFCEFCVSIRRNNQHVKMYLESELSVDSSITESGALILDKIFESSRVLAILEQYINEFVICKETKCKSKCTNFQKEDRINYLVCEVCKSKTAILLKFI